MRVFVKPGVAGGWVWLGGPGAVSRRARICGGGGCVAVGCRGLVLRLYLASRRAWCPDSLRNAVLTAELQATIDELRASRRRLVEAQDAERRKIERNLHDGAQQQLIALTIQLALLEESAGDPAAVRQLAPAVKDGLRAALEDLRDLARGIYPPLLADQGLVPALQAQARKASVPVEIDADGIGRYPQEAEAAVYFCTREALQNITKYAGASHATVGLSCSGGSLQFTITDNGTGFDTTTRATAPACKA